MPAHGGMVAMKPAERLAAMEEVMARAAQLWGYESPFEEVEPPDGDAAATGRRAWTSRPLPLDRVGINDARMQHAWFSTIAAYVDDKRRGYPGQDDTMVPRLDALVLWATVRSWKPARVLEIGGGISTNIMAYAAIANQRDAGGDGAPAAITVVEPYRTSVISAFPHVRILQQRVQDADLALVRQLQAGACAGGRQARVGASRVTLATLATGAIFNPPPPSLSR